MDELFCDFRAASLASSKARNSAVTRLLQIIGYRKGAVEERAFVQLGNFRFDAAKI